MIVMAGMTGRALAGEKVCPLQVKGMQCSMCAGSVAAALKSVPGVKSAKVDYKTARADVIADDAVKPDQLVSAVRKAGFQATALSATK
ncbi:MAG TPA: heavy metal-associated domain-containing protein [Candidatus Binataceae bacterium]|nr:heavy metal-associated domain-containing protein [Candidatus Binataceae bacterium]